MFGAADPLRAAFVRRRGHQLVVLVRILAEHEHPDAEALGLRDVSVLMAGEFIVRRREHHATGPAHVAPEVLGACGIDVRLRSVLICKRPGPLAAFSKTLYSIVCAKRRRSVSRGSTAEPVRRGMQEHGTQQPHPRVPVGDAYDVAELFELREHCVW